MRLLLRLLGVLHKRGLHAAVLAGLLVMPTVTAVGFLTDSVSTQKPPVALLDLGPLRGTLDTADSGSATRS